MKIREATKNDINDVVKLLFNDQLGQTREDLSSPLSEKYTMAFDKIENDPNQELIVIEDGQNEIIGTLQLTFIQYLTYQGGIRAQIEAVRIRGDYRGQGIGENMFKWAINRAKERGAHLVQLTTNKKRIGALKFYYKLGFQDTHEGMKLFL